VPITGGTECLKYTKHVTLYPCYTAMYKALATDTEQITDTYTVDKTT